MPHPVLNVSGYFEAETVESWESVGRELIINLRNTGLTTITITAPNINKAYRDMEIICRTHKIGMKTISI